MTPTRRTALTAGLPKGKPGVSRTGWTGTVPLAVPPEGTVRIVGIDVGLARVSVAVFELGPREASRWYASDLNRRMSAYRACWYVTTPGDWDLGRRCATIGREMTAMLRVVRPTFCFVEQPQDAGLYQRNQEDSGKFGGKLNRDMSKVYAALGIIAAVCYEQAGHQGGALALQRPARFGLKSAKKADRLAFVRECLTTLRNVTLTNDNDVDAVGVALGADWPL